MHERCAADWYVPYVAELSPDETWNLLRAQLLVQWNWDLFIWDLRELLRLLTTAPAEFDYLFLTYFLKARAAYLAATGPFDFTQQDILIGIGTKRVQFATIYYRLLLAKLRLVTTKTLGRYRRHAILLMAVGAAILTPTPDPFTMLMVLVPMYLLYELGIVLTRFA